MNNDLIFEAHEARFEPIGPTTRIGAVFYAQARPLPWLFGAFSVTYVKATLDETPEPEPGEPPSGLEAGDPIPFVPPWLLRLDVGASDDLVDLGKHPLRGKLGLGYTFVSERPLRFSETSPRVNLLELSAGLSWWFFELGFQVFNLLDTRYAAQEFVFESNWSSDNPAVGPTRTTHRRRRSPNLPLPNRLPPLIEEPRRSLHRHASPAGDRARQSPTELRGWRNI